MVFQIAPVGRDVKIAHGIAIVALQLRADHQRMALDPARDELQLRAVPGRVEQVAVERDGRIVIDVIAARGVAPPVDPGRDIAGLVQCVLPGRVEAVARIDRARLRGIEQLVVRRRRRALGALAVSERQAELPRAALGEDLLAAVEIHTHGDAVVGVGPVERREVQVASRRVADGGREQPFGAALGAVAPRHAPSLACRLPVEALACTPPMSPPRRVMTLMTPNSALEP